MGPGLLLRAHLCTGCLGGVMQRRYSMPSAQSALHTPAHRHQCGAHTEHACCARLGRQPQSSAQANLSTQLYRMSSSFTCSMWPQVRGRHAAWAVRLPRPLAWHAYVDAQAEHT